MKFTSAFTFLTLAASSVYGSAIDLGAHDANSLEVNNLATRATCSNSDMQAVKDRINHYNVFCQMYNAQSRDSSPLPTLSAAKLTSACSCLLKQWNKKSNPTSVPSTAANTCAASDINLIKKEAPRNYQSYCKWWGLIARTQSGIPGVSASQVTKSCKCLLASTGSTASTAVKVTSTKKTTSSTAKATSTAVACKKRRKVRRTVTVEVPAVATPEPVAN